MGEIENIMAIVFKTTALLLLCTAVIASGSRAPNPRPRRSGSGSGSGSGTSAPTLAPTLAPTGAPSAAPTKYPTGAPANTPTNTPTVGYTAAATQITQTIVQTIPGVDSAATFNAEPNVKIPPVLQQDQVSACRPMVNSCNKSKDWSQMQPICSRALSDQHMEQLKPAEGM